MLKKAVAPLFCAALVVFFGGGIMAGGDDLCDDLVFSSELLEGLCEAICEAAECEIEDDDDSSDDSSEEDCDPPSRHLIDFYNQIKQPGDPDLPCIAPDCPCFTQEEVDSIGGKVGQNIVSCDDETAATPEINVVATGPLGLQLAELNEVDAECRYVDQPAVTRVMPVDPDEASVCRAMILDRIQLGPCP